MRRAAVALLVSCSLGCVPHLTRMPREASALTKERAALQLVESWPEGTTLDHPDIEDASSVWLRLVRTAQTTIDFAEFYASEAEPPFLEGSRLRPILEALDAATRRGVKVRFLSDATFAAKYPATLDALRRARADVRTWDVAKDFGGVLHAKYFVVDGTVAYVGSQNFDWRALQHIQEIGVRVDGPLAVALQALFDADWARAGGTVAPPHPELVASATFGEAEVTVAASPETSLPEGLAWDLPKLVALVRSAKTTFRVQLLTMSTKGRDGSTWTTLDDELRAAAARGVKVSVLVSHWAVKEGSASRSSLEALARVPNVEVRVLTIPRFGDVDIPFARVAHAKYALADATANCAWIGTSNWEKDYFVASRNVSVFVCGGELPANLGRVFTDGWGSSYAAPLVPATPSTPPTPGAAPRGRARGPGAGVPMRAIVYPSGP